MLLTSCSLDAASLRVPLARVAPVLPVQSVVRHPVKAKGMSELLCPLLVALGRGKKKDRLKRRQGVRKKKVNDLSSHKEASATPD